MAEPNQAFFFSYFICDCLNHFVGGGLLIATGDLELGNLIAFIDIFFHALFLVYDYLRSVFMCIRGLRVSLLRGFRSLRMEPAILRMKA